MESNIIKRKVATQKIVESNNHMSEGYSQSKNEEEKINVDVEDNE